MREVGVSASASQPASVKAERERWSVVSGDEDEDPVSLESLWFRNFDG